MEGESNWKQALWEKRWKENQLRWHKHEVNQFLIKYLSRITLEDNKTGDVLKFKKFFIPLCGKTKDIAYILNFGHSVFAVEGVKQAIETLNKENDFNLEFNDKESIYSTPDNKLIIYLGNIFTCPIEKYGPFDCVWDRGALTALDTTFWPSYKEIMRRSVFETLENGKPQEFRYLLVTFDYDISTSDGRGPKCVNEKDMNNIFKDWANFVLLESAPLASTHVIKVMVGDDSPCFENVYLIMNK